MSSQPNERWTSSWRMWAALVMPRMAPAWAIALAVSAPLLVAPAQATVFVVNSTVDSVDALPGDGVVCHYSAHRHAALRS